MTGQQIYELASSFLYERDGDDNESKAFCVSFLNILLQEALPIENSIRRAENRATLAAAPTITSLNAEVPYADSITRVAFPYGIASFFFQEAMNTFQAENYRAKYIGALADAKRYNAEPISNVYESGE